MPLILLPIILAIVVGCVFWFLADLKYSIAWSKKRSELSSAGKWKELNTHFEKALKTKRPFLRLFERLVMPGVVEVDYGLHLYNQGRNEEALTLVDKALAKAGGRANRHATWEAMEPELKRLHALRRTMFGMAAVSRTQILNGMGRYDEARASAKLAQTSDTSGAMASMIEGLIELYNGNISEALRLAEKAMKDQKANDASRAMASGALAAKGRFQDAMNVLIYEPGKITAFFEPEELEVVTEDQPGRELVAAMDKDLAGVMQPGRYLGQALVCLEAGDVKNFALALDRAKKVMQAQPAIEHIYVRLRTICCAMQADTTGMETHLARARVLAREIPSRSARYETHLAAGRAYLAMGQNESALSDLEEAAKLALHPLEKHTTNYWRARAAEAAGRSDLAAQCLTAVTEDGFDTWMRADAQRRVAATN